MKEFKKAFMTELAVALAGALVKIAIDIVVDKIKKKK